jgi:hypothetical protein
MNNYYIEGASHVLNKRFANGELNYLTFQEDLTEFKNLIIKLEKDKKGASFVHFGDGDYFFLKKQAVGSATPGKRALSIPYDKFDITPFREGWLKADYHCVEYLEPGNKDKLLELYPGQKTIATEFLYGLTMNRWFFQHFKGKIGLIGAGEKLDIIKELMKYPEYQQYLGIDKINDYINVPQKFACDNIENTLNMVKTQLENSNPETFVYLYGVGHVKSGLIHHLPKIKNAIYLDIGAGIDALAGLIDPDRPYASSWINYQMKNYTYGNIDLLQYSRNNDKNLRVI